MAAFNLRQTFEHALADDNDNLMTTSHPHHTSIAASAEPSELSGQPPSSHVGMPRMPFIDHPSGPSPLPDMRQALVRACAVAFEYVQRSAMVRVVRGFVLED
jgi:hypothetical protein